MENNYIIRLEKKEEYRAVENLVRESFWNVYRPGCSEHYVIHVLRDDPAFIKELDFVMEQDGRIIGQNMFMRTIIEADDDRTISVLTMGPICIANDLKRQGYGKALLDYSLEKAAALGQIRYPLSRPARGRGFVVLPLQGAEKGLSRRYQRCVSDAEGLLCRRCGG